MLSTLIYYPVHGLAIIWGNKIIQYDLWMICLFVRCFGCLLLLYCEMVILLCSLFNVYYLLINFVHFHVTCILLYVYRFILIDVYPLPTWFCWKQISLNMFVLSVYFCSFSTWLTIQYHTMPSRYRHTIYLCPHLKFWIHCVRYGFIHYSFRPINI
jgi:hypothetical protein